MVGKLLGGGLVLLGTALLCRAETRTRRQQTERLAELWRKKKNRSRFELLDVADHTFYHFNVNAAYFEQMLNSWSSFMVEQGIWEYNEGMDAGLLG